MATAGTSDTHEPDANLSFNMLDDPIFAGFQDPFTCVFFNSNQDSCAEALADNEYPYYVDPQPQWLMDSAQDSSLIPESNVSLNGNPSAVLHPGSTTLPNSMYKPGPRTAPRAGIADPTGANQDTYGCHTYTQVTNTEQPSSSSSVPYPIRIQDYNGYVNNAGTITLSTSSSSKKRKTDDSDCGDIRLSSSTMASDRLSNFSVPHSRSSMTSNPTTARSSMSISVTSAPMTPFSTAAASETATLAVSTPFYPITTVEEDSTEEGPYVCPGCNMGDPDFLPQRKSGGKVRQQKLKGTFVGKHSTWYEQHLKGFHSKLFKPDNDPEKFLCRLCPCTQATQERCGARFKDWDTLFRHVRDLHSQPMSGREVHCHACPPLSTHSLVRKIFGR